MFHHPSYNRTEALARVKPDQHVFEYDKEEAKQCYILTFDEFMVQLIHQIGPRYYNEIIHPDRPCRFYLDCETNEGGREVDLETYVTTISKELSAVIKKHLKRPLVLKASRRDKFSVHLLWDEWVRSTFGSTFLRLRSCH